METYFPAVENEDQKTASESEKELQQMYANLIFKTSNKSYGETAHLAKKDSKFGKSSKYSGHLGASGMYKNEGLNTCVERDKVFDGSKDWMDKI